MAHRDLLPRLEQLQELLRDDVGLTPDQVQQVCANVALHLQDWADYYDDEYLKGGDKTEAGARDALREQVEIFRGLM